MAMQPQQPLGGYAGTGGAYSLTRMAQAFSGGGSLPPISMLHHQQRFSLSQPSLSSTDLTAWDLQLTAEDAVNVAGQLDSIQAKCNVQLSMHPVSLGMLNVCCVGGVNQVAQARSMLLLSLHQAHTLTA